MEILKGILDYSKEGYEKLKKLIKDKANEGKYVFVPNEKETLQLLAFSKDPEYLDILHLIPKYRYIDVLRTGLLIKEYHKNDTTENRKRVEEIKREIVNKPNGGYFLKLANLPTTPFFSIIITFLHDLMKRGYSNTFLEEKFDEIVQKWEVSSYFVKTGDKKERVIEFCETRISNKDLYFFVLGMRKAANTVEDAVNDLIKKGIFEEKNYGYNVIKGEEGNHPRVEVTIFRKE